MPPESGVPCARRRGRLRPLTKPWRCRTAWIVLLAGMRRLPSIRRTRSSRIFRAPMRLLLLTSDDQGLKPALLVPIEDFVAGLSGYPERPANLAHRLAIQDKGDKLQTLVHHRTLLPRHRHPPLNRGKCYPCVRYVLSPMCRAAHHFPDATAAAFPWRKLTICGLPLDLRLISPRPG